jgi:hypothetical protein
MFSNNRRDGQGTFNWNNKNRYSGGWREDQQDGYGTKVWASGDRYQGQWRQNLMSG